MQAKLSVQSKQILVAISVLAINLPVASPASSNILAVINEKGENVSVNKSLIKLTPVQKGALFAELKNMEAVNRSLKLQYEECMKSIQKYYCWKIYGNDALEAKRTIPGTLLQIAFDPLYVVVAFKPIFTDLNNQRRIGEDLLTVCLNPNVPSGYWSLINQYKPILKVTPKVTNNQQPMEELKSKVCKYLVKF